MGEGWDDFSPVFPVETGTHRTRKSGHYMLNELGACGRQGECAAMGPVVRLGMVGEPDPHRSEDRPLHRELDPVVVRVTGRRGGSRSSGGRNCGWLFAEGVDVLALGKMDGLDESLGET